MAKTKIKKEVENLFEKIQDTADKCVAAMKKMKMTFKDNFEACADVPYYDDTGTCFHVLVAGINQGKVFFIDRAFVDYDRTPPSLLTKSEGHKWFGVPIKELLNRFDCADVIKIYDNLAHEK